MKTVLTIAGSDCSGGAGIQADLKTILAHKAYGMSVITSLTAQNTIGVQGIYNIPAEFTGRQLDSICQDIFPDAVKIGMVSDINTIHVIAQKITQYHLPFVVLDPVMISTSGSVLLEDNAIQSLMEHLFPLADIITPNIPEAEHLSGVTIHTKTDMEKAAEAICSYTNGNILIKGGHLEGEAWDLLYTGKSFHWFYGPRQKNENSHGTGCTLSSAIACNLAHGYSVYKSIALGKKYVETLLKDTLNLGNGSGPLNHCRTLL